jgi:hypothetical protein
MDKPFGRSFRLNDEFSYRVIALEVQVISVL